MTGVNGTDIFVRNNGIDIGKMGILQIYSRGPYGIGNWVLGLGVQYNARRKNP